MKTAWITESHMKGRCPEESLHLQWNLCEQETKLGYVKPERRGLSGTAA